MKSFEELDKKTKELAVEKKTIVDLRKELEAKNKEIIKLQLDLKSLKSQQVINPSLFATVDFGG